MVADVPFNRHRPQVLVGERVEFGRSRAVPVGDEEAWEAWELELEIRGGRGALLENGDDVRADHDEQGTIGEREKGPSVEPVGVGKMRQRRRIIQADVGIVAPVVLAAELLLEPTLLLLLGVNGVAELVGGA